MVEPASLRWPGQRPLQQFLAREQDLRRLSSGLKHRTPAATASSLQYFPGQSPSPLGGLGLLLRLKGCWLLVPHAWYCVWREDYWWGTGVVRPRPEERNHLMRFWGFSPLPLVSWGQRDQVRAFVGPSPVCFGLPYLNPGG